MTENTSIVEADFSDELSNAADRVYSYSAILRTWDKDEENAKEAIAAGSLSSFSIDNLIGAASTREHRRYIEMWLKKVDDTCTRNTVGRVTTVTDEEKFLDLLRYFNELVTDRYTDWYRPNSTSNVDVEIKLGQHEAWQQLYKIAQGKRF